MQEEIMYPVCPHRNVPAAFHRFLGPDSGGFERFFPHERMHRVDGTLLVVRFHGKKAARVISGSIEDFNAALSRAWSSTAAACLSFALASGKDATRLIGQTAALLFGTRAARLPV
jgi:hypothetical protein